MGTGRPPASSPVQETERVSPRPLKLRMIWPDWSVTWTRHHSHLDPEAVHLTSSTPATIEEVDRRGRKILGRPVSYATVRIDASFAYRRSPGHEVKPASRCPEIRLKRTHCPSGYLPPVLPREYIQTFPIGGTCATSNRHARSRSMLATITEGGVTVEKVPSAETAKLPVLNPLVAPGRTGRSIPPYRPSNTRPNLSTRK